MSVINLADFKKKKEEKQNLQSVKKIHLEDDLDEKKFVNEVKRFRWMGMNPKASFVKIDNSKFPPAFPPDDFPPMAA